MTCFESSVCYEKQALFKLEDHIGPNNVQLQQRMCTDAIDVSTDDMFQELGFHFSFIRHVVMYAIDVSTT
jgi:hypothetical protein